MKTKKTVARKSTKKQAHNPLRAGNAVLIRTITHYFIGVIDEVVKRGGDNLLPGYLLTKCSWVADTGSFSQCVKLGIVSDSEAYDPEQRVFVNAEVIVDAVKWDHSLPPKAHWG